MKRVLEVVLNLESILHSLWRRPRTLALDWWLVLLLILIWHCSSLIGGDVLHSIMGCLGCLLGDAVSTGGRSGDLRHWRLRSG